MAKVVNLMVACGSGIATSVHVAQIVREYMQDKKLRVNINTCSVNDLLNRLSGIDIVLSTAQISFETGLPVFNGVPLLTGIGEEQILEAMAEKIKELSEE